MTIKRILKFNNFGHELFIFKILLIAIDWNFRVQLAVAALVKSILINLQAKMGAGARWINMDIFFYQSQITVNSFWIIPKKQVKSEHIQLSGKKKWIRDGGYKSCINHDPGKYMSWPPCIRSGHWPFSSKIVYPIRLIIVPIKISCQDWSLHLPKSIIPIYINIDNSLLSVTSAWIFRLWIYFAESVAQDQTAHTCSLILLCTLRCFCQRNCTQEHLTNWLIELCFFAAVNSISVMSRRQLTLFISPRVTPVLNWGFEVSCPRTLPRKNPEDPGKLEPMIPWIKSQRLYY